MMGRRVGRPGNPLRLSLVIPVYNEPRVARAIESVLSQEGSEKVELLVIDGGSRRETLDAIEKFRDRIDVLVSEPDKGVYDAMNKGIARATGDVVGVLSANDHYADTRALKDVVDAMASGTDTCYGDVVYEDANGRIVRYWRSGPPSRAKFYTGWMPAHPTFFVRKEVYERHGTFDRQYGTAADYELTLRLLFRHRVSTTYIPRVLVRMSTGGLSGQGIARSNMNAWRAWRNNGLRGGALVPVLKPLQKTIQFVRRP